MDEQKLSDGRVKPDDPTSVTVTVGHKLFEFASFNAWVDFAQRFFRSAGVHDVDVLCLDAKGRVCRAGKQFRVARDNNAFPVTVYRILNPLGDRLLPWPPEESEREKEVQEEKP
jgi:hypothetical protein